MRNGILNFCLFCFSWLIAFGVMRAGADPITFHCDGGNRGKIAYDRTFSPNCVYDVDLMRAEGPSEIEPSGSAPSFIGFVEFLAAKTEANVTRLGITRNNPADWRATRDLWDQTGYGGILSDANRTAIARGRAPVVDEAWISHFPEDAGLVGERIPMNHIGGGPITVPLPATRHLNAHMPGGFRYNPGGRGSALPVFPAPNP